MTPLITWQWTELKNSTDYRGAAAYAVRLRNRTGAVSIPRFLGTDTEGLLTIGKSTNLEKRRCRFIRGLEKGQGHSAANILFFLKRFEAHRSIIEEATYEISFCAVTTPEEALAMESRLTRDYLSRFGEVPPLTSMIPDRYAHLEKI